MSVRGAILDFLRVPPTPEPPPGSPPRVFRAAPNYFKLRLLQWGITQMLAIFGLAWAIWFLHFILQTGTPNQQAVRRQVLFVDASFQLNPGEKVGLVGPTAPARRRSSG
jgi:hypothetical protein